MTVALYRHYDESGALLYVGISCDLTRRTRSHAKFSPWFEQVHRTTVEYFGGVVDALRSEEIAVRTESPRHNVMFSRGGDVGSLFAMLGRAELAQRLGVGMTAISNAAVRESIPASWFLVVRAMCMERALECPEYMFAFTEDQLA